MSIAIIGNIVTTTASTTDMSRQEPAADGTEPRASPPQAAAPPELAQQDATITTLSDEALARQAAAAQLAHEATAAAAPPTLAEVVTSDWAAGAPVVDSAVVQEAFAALDEASRKNLQVAADALAAYQDQVALEQKAIAAATADADQQHDLVVLAAINAGIRLAYGALPSTLTGDPILREPAQVDVIA